MKKSIILIALILVIGSANMALAKHNNKEGLKQKVESAVESVREQSEDLLTPTPTLDPSLTPTPTLTPTLTPTPTLSPTPVLDQDDENENEVDEENENEVQDENQAEEGHHNDGPNLGNENTEESSQ